MKKDFIKLNNVDKRKNNWLKNALRVVPLQLTSKRKNFIWIFGSWEGNRYDDNSKYLFEYVLKNYQEIKPFWVTSNSEIFSKLEKDNKPVLMSGTEKAKNIMLEAGVFFYTHGLDDFGYVNYCSGAYLVNLTHSVSGIKKEYYMSSKGIKRILKKIKDYLFDWYKFDVTIVSSAEARKWRMDIHANSKIEKFPITGLPRNDLLRFPNKYCINKPKCMQKEAIYVSFLPTYRPYSNDVIKEFINAINKDNEFKDFLEENNIFILIKPHSVDITSNLNNIKLNSRVYITKENEIDSTQEMLVYTDILVTDYSSACMDFSLTNKPIIMFAPDYQKYNDYHGIVDSWINIYKSNIVKKDFNSFKEELFKCINEKSQNEMSIKLREIYEDESIKDTIYCENVYQYVLSKLNINNKEEEK